MKGLGWSKATYIQMHYTWKYLPLHFGGGGTFYDNKTHGCFPFFLGWGIRILVMVPSSWLVLAPTSLPLHIYIRLPGQTFSRKLIGKIAGGCGARETQPFRKSKNDIKSYFID